MRRLGLGRRALRFLVRECGLGSGRPPLRENRLAEALPGYPELIVHDMLVSACAEVDPGAAATTPPPPAACRPPPPA